jgi:uroporphyrinogen-III synthase
MMESKLRVKSVLITQPKPENDKNPYSELAKKYNLKIDFRSFIHVDGVPAKDFRKLKISLQEHTSVIFLSRNAADHYFRMCEEMRFEVPSEMKYFCNSESTALYLQKYIQFRKRRIFFSKQNGAELMELFKKHPTEKFIFPCSDVHKEELPSKLRELGYQVTEAVMYKTVVSNISDLADVNYDIIVFFSPSGIKSLYVNFPNFKQNKTRIAAFGNTTVEAVGEAGLHLDIKAPTPQSPSMTMAIEEYVKKTNK